MPGGGGFSRAYRFGRDSLLWISAAKVPAVQRVLAFDDEQGVLAYIDAGGVPGRLDLRVARATAAAESPLRGLESADGWAIYGFSGAAQVSRLTPSGTWSFTPLPAPRLLVPLPDGGLVLLHDDGERSLLRRLRPPEPRVTDTASVPHADLVLRTDIGDRIYVSGADGLSSVRVRGMVRGATTALPAPALAMVATPSGDRVFVSLKGKHALAVVDRYSEKIEHTISLPHDATALRIDSDGQYILARAGTDDSVYVVSVGTSRLIGSVVSQWRDDLPVVGPDGGIAVVQGPDVVVVDAESHRERTRFLSGAADTWALIRWNGFRPRAAGLDAPVQFDDPGAAATPPDDTTRFGPPTAAPQTAVPAAAAPVPPAAASPQPAAARPPASSPIVGPPAEAPASAAAPRRDVSWNVAFASLQSELRAQTLSASITIDGKPTRVIASAGRDGVNVYRIVGGPFPTKDAADKAGKKTGLPYWVYEGTP